MSEAKDDKQESKYKKKLLKKSSYDAKHNLKAFAIQSTVKAERSFRRKQDIVAKREHAPQVDRTAQEPPPVVVAVVGPPKVGKTSLIRCLLRNYTRQNINEIQGPVTVVSGKNRRLTFLECNNDINCMIDVAKVADLVLLMVDASFGFEMETFEFLNICQSHGFPRIMGVLTHLDVIKNPRKLRRTKKSLKHRFWTEIYAGAKLFYLSKFVHNQYLRNEINNLARFISVMKFRPLQWTTNHPYMLVDRVEDITQPEIIRQNEKSNRTVCLFGYSRGANFKPDQDIHIPGCGDFKIKNITFIPDPCPLPNKEKTTAKRRSLNEKEKRIYAPMSGVGGIVFDKDAIYIDLGGSHSFHGEGNTEQSNSYEDKLVSSLNANVEPLNEMFHSTEMQLFSNAAPIAYNGDEIFEDGNEQRVRRKVKFNDEADSEAGGSDESDNSDDENDEMESDENGILPKKDDNDSHDEQVEFESSDEEFDELDRQSSWRTDLKRKASEAFYKRVARTDNIQQLVYSDSSLLLEDLNVENDEKHLSDGLFKVLEAKNESEQTMKLTLNSYECTKFPEDLLLDFSSKLTLKFIRDCFVTGKWADDEDASTMLKKDREARQLNDEDGDSDSSSIYGDFEDYENGEPETDNNNNNQDIDEESNLDDNNEEQDIMDKKLSKKQMFDCDYDNLKSADVINPEEKTFLDFEKERAQKQSEVRIQ